MKHFLVIISFVVVSLAVIAGNTQAMHTYDEIVGYDNNCQRAREQYYTSLWAEHKMAQRDYLNNYCPEYKITLGE